MFLLFKLEIEQIDLLAHAPFPSLLPGSMPPSRKAAPDAVETISYQIPTFTLGGNLVHFAAFKSHLSLHELLISMFLFLTAPITAHFLAKAHIHRHVDPVRELPRPDGHGWGTFEAPHDAAAEMKAVMDDGPDPAAAEKAHNDDAGRSPR